MERGKHPNSLKNLRHATPPYNFEDKEIREKAMKQSEKTRQETVLKRRNLKDAIKNIGLVKKEIEDATFSQGLDKPPEAIDILRSIMYARQSEGDDDGVIEVARILLEFETPKQARSTHVVEQVDGSSMSDEELQEAIKAITRDNGLPVIGED